MNRTKPTKLITLLRIIIPIWLTFFLISFCVFFIFVPSLKKNIVNQKKEMTRNLIDNSYCLLSAYYQKVLSGEMSEKNAKFEAKELIRTMRYGSEKKDYFWINDMSPKMIMHPYLPQLEGKDVSNIVDYKGIHIVEEFVKLVRVQGEGYIDYMWQWKDKPDTIVPKISYIKGFKPWGWIIGTGIYIKDVNNEINIIINNLFKIFTGLLIIIIIISSYITWQTIKIENRRSLAEKALIKSEKNYRIIFENTGTATVIIDNNRIISLANDKFIELAGYSRQEIHGKKKWTEFIHPDDFQQIKKQEASNIYEFRFIDRNKNIRNIIVSINKIPESSKHIASFSDITKRKRAEDALKASQKRFLTVLNSIDATIFVLDMKTYKIIFMNKYMIECFGKDHTGEFCWEAFRGEKSQCSHCNNHLLVDKNNHPTGVHTWQGENPVTDKWFLNYDRAIEWEDGRLVKIQIATDITALKNMEKELRQVHKMESLGTLAGGIAHDFNNILFPIVGYAEMLLEEMPEDNIFRDSVEKIHSSSLRAKDLVKQILTFARHDLNEFKPMMIQPIIKEVLKFIRASIPASITIKQNISKNCGLIKADPTQIHQIVMNLATNAYHAMEKSGGKLSITLKETEIDQQNNFKTSDIKPGLYACLTIADTGVGMDKGIAEKIFDPFFTTKELGKGTGMGLSVVHGIVKNMNGAIQVKSELGYGSKFSIYLPVIAKSIQEPKQKDNEIVPRGDGQILLVDDEEEITEMGRQMLERHGYKVSAHTDSIEALKIFKTCPDNFDIVITDMAMPNMSGDELAKKISTLKPDIPIILCTGYSETMSEEKALSIGIKTFLAKPVIMKELVAKIRELLNND